MSVINGQLTALQQNNLSYLRVSGRQPTMLFKSWGLFKGKSKSSSFASFMKPALLLTKHS